jgi:hypothetical protein
MNGLRDATQIPELGLYREWAFRRRTQPSNAVIAGRSRLSNAEFRDPSGVEYFFHADRGYRHLAPRPPANFRQASGLKTEVA